MPFTTLYQIYDSKHKTPIFTNTDKTMAYVEWRDCLRRGGDIYRLEQTVMPDGDLSKQEEFLMLVYRIRKLWRRYKNTGEHCDRMVCLEQEKKLDAWNERTRAFIDSHTGFIPKDKEGHNFFIVVEAWREAWKKHKKYSPKNGFDEIVQKEIGRECRQYAKEIDKYIKTKLNLL